MHSFTDWVHTGGKFPMPLALWWGHGIWPWGVGSGPTTVPMDFCRFMGLWEQAQLCVGYVCVEVHEHATGRECIGNA